MSSRKADVCRIPFSVKAAFGLGQEILYGQCAAEDAMHARNGVADAHGVPRVAMITRADGAEMFLFVLPKALLVLQSHFQSNLYSHGTAVCIKNLV